ncbi:MAG: hypothetical protein GY763_01410 [Gammaproteobacteria bacterium]|nr:hypothetical protein [Gammaproteobacteria bacterium]
MIEIDAAIFILLIEVLAILLVALALVIVLGIRRKRKKYQGVVQLVAQIKKQSEVRTQETGSFLQEIYQLEDDELKKAVSTIDKSEKNLFQKLIECFLTDSPELISKMDAVIAGLIDTYKELKPKEQIIEMGSEENEKLLNDEIEKLKGQNDRLEEELRITKETMGNMIGEFGNMFGGGSDHELASFEVVEKVEEQVDTKS